jgi:hypothetical protein
MSPRRKRKEKKRKAQKVVQLASTREKKKRV